MSGRANSAPNPRSHCPICGRSIAYFETKNALRQHGRPPCIGSGMDINTKAEAS